MAYKRKYDSQQPESPTTPDILPNNSPEMVNAAEALTLLYTTSPSQSGLASPTTTPYNESYDDHPNMTHPLVSRVNKLSEHPIISNAVKYYESTKKSFGPFNYAAELVEKSAIPMVNKIEVNLNSRYQQRILNENIEQINNKKRKINHEETKKRIQFCLHILRLANDNINNHVSELTDMVDEQQVKAKEEKEVKQEDVEEKEKEKEKETVEQDKLVESKVEIVTTVKKIIHLISNFKPSSLSIDQENLKVSIRQIILNLPSQLNGQDNDKVFVFAKESLDMIGKLTNVFNDQLDKVENWIGLENDDNELTAVNSNTSNEERNGRSSNSNSTNSSSSSNSHSNEKVDRISIDMLTD